MPIYEYRCASCGKVFEVLERIAAKPARNACPGCGARRAARVFSRFGFSSGSPRRGSTGGGGCAGCRPSPGRCGTCGGH